MSSRRRRRRRALGIEREGQVRSNTPLQLIAYGAAELVEAEIRSPEEARSYLARYPVTWLNVDGTPDPPTLAAIGAVFGLHRLALEDVVHVHQRAKVERYGDHHFIVARMVTYDSCLETEQLSVFQGGSFVITFQERPGVDSLGAVRARLRQGNEWLRGAGAGRLAYSLLDAVVDGYYPVLEHCGERLEALESEILDRPTRGSMTRVYDVKRDLLALRRAIWPLREAVGSLFREPSALVSEETRLYLRDCYDHVIQVIDLIETYRELGSGLTDLYLSSVSQRMNEVMKVLTIIATIFIPLTFVVGVYGMNFDTQRSPWNMPELEWYWGYPLVWGLMITMTVGMLLFFRRKGWLGEGAVVETPADVVHADRPGELHAGAEPVHSPPDRAGH